MRKALRDSMPTTVAGPFLLRMPLGIHFRAAPRGCGRATPLGADVAILRGALSGLPASGSNGLLPGALRSFGMPTAPMPAGRKVDWQAPAAGQARNPGTPEPLLPPATAPSDAALASAV